MKKTLLLAPLLAFSLSCEKNEPPPAGPDPAPPGHSPTRIDKNAIPSSPEPEIHAAPTNPAPPPQTGPPPLETPQTPPLPAPNSTSIPHAVPVEGKPGYVHSPYNGSIIDVRDLPSGMLVADPTFPASEKKLFRVP